MSSCKVPDIVVRF